MQDIYGLTLQELKAIFSLWQEPAYRASQVYAWIYRKNAADFSLMSDLSAPLRAKLEQEFCLSGVRVAKTLTSSDATQKLLLALGDENFVEAVIIPAKGRTTGCISSQVGCKFNCKFCASGLLGFKRNLTASEMVEEVLAIKRQCIQDPLSHVVFMGTGEPLDNYDQVLKSVRIMNASEGLRIGARRITISTCGIIPGIQRLAEEKLQIELSISLHAAIDKTRSFLMPVNKKYPLKDLIICCKDYIRKTSRQITFEYILLKGINSDLQSAKELGTMMQALKLCKVNLIPSNLVAECNAEPPNKMEVLLFRDYLVKQGAVVTLRRARGQDVQAACGQLRLHHEQ